MRRTLCLLTCTSFARPTPELGTPCTGDASCGLATCRDTPSGPRCTRPCDAASECPGGWSCEADEHAELGPVQTCRCLGGGSESCDGADDDCDGAVDEEEGPEGLFALRTE